MYQYGDRNEIHGSRRGNRQVHDSKLLKPVLNYYGAKQRNFVKSKHCKAELPLLTYAPSWHDRESDAFMLATFCHPQESRIPSSTVWYISKRWDDGRWTMGGCWTMKSTFHVCWPRWEIRMLLYHQVWETKQLDCKKDRSCLLLCKDTVYWNSVLRLVCVLCHRYNWICHLPSQT